MTLPINSSPAAPFRQPARPDRSTQPPFEDVAAAPDRRADTADSYDIAAVRKKPSAPEPTSTALNEDPAAPSNAETSTMALLNPLAVSADGTPIIPQTLEIASPVVPNGNSLSSLPQNAQGIISDSSKSGTAPGGITATTSPTAPQAGTPGTVPTGTGAGTTTVTGNSAATSQLTAAQVSGDHVAAPSPDSALPEIAAGTASLSQPRNGAGPDNQNRLADLPATGSSSGRNGAVRAPGELVMAANSAPSGQTGASGNSAQPGTAGGTGIGGAGIPQTATDSTIGTAQIAGSDTPAASVSRPMAEQPQVPQLPQLPAQDIRVTVASGETINTAPRAQTPLPAPGQVAVHIGQLAKSGNDRITVDLHPAELGRVSVKLDIGEQGRLLAVISADRPETLEQLQRDSQTLERALQNAGFDAGRENFTFNLRDEDGLEWSSEADDAAATDAEASGSEIDDQTLAALSSRYDYLGPDRVDILI